MKPCLPALVLITFIAGCSTPPPPEASPGKYIIQAVVIEVPSELALKDFPKFEFGLDPTHMMFSSPDGQLPALHISVSDMNHSGHNARIGELEGQMKRFYDALDMSAYVESLMQLPEAKVAKLPAASVSVGEQYVYDATETMELPADYDIVEGKAVVSHYTFKSGHSIDLQLVETQEAMASYRLKIYIGHLRGFETYPLPNGEEIKMQYVATRSYDIEVTQPVGYCFAPYGLVCESMGDDKAESKTILFGIRISKAE